MTYKNSTPIWLLMLVGTVWLFAGCTLTMPSSSAPDNPDVRATDSVRDGWVDASPTLYGLCFESMLDAAGQVFILRSEVDLIRLYDLADNSQLCERPVTREMFDFTGGRVLVGTWSAGLGCTARHDITTFDRDDESQTLDIVAQFITEGDCPYELVRPLWLGLDNVVDYDISLQVTP